MLAMIQGEVVEKRRWVSQEEFGEAVMLGQILPGPAAVDAVTHAGTACVAGRGRWCRSSPSSCPRSSCGRRHGPGRGMEKSGEIRREWLPLEYTYRVYLLGVAPASPIAVSGPSAQPSS